MTVHTQARTDELVGLFPPGTGLDGDGTVMVGGCRLDDVAEQFGTPAIVVSEDALRQRAWAGGNHSRPGNQYMISHRWHR